MDLVLAGRVAGESRQDDQYLLGREEAKKIKTVGQKRYAREKKVNTRVKKWDSSRVMERHTRNEK